jgi:hypothetical protein
MKYLFHTRRALLHAVKTHYMEPPALFPSEGRRASDFMSLKNVSPPPGLNPRTLGWLYVTIRRL